jgi:hydrogenase-4 component E
MNVSPFELMVLSPAVVAILMAGSNYLRINISLYSIQTLCIAAASAWQAINEGDTSLLCVAIGIGLIKGFGIPFFLIYIVDRIKISNLIDSLWPAPLLMHLSIGLFGLSFLFSQGLPAPLTAESGWPGATAAISLLMTGLVFMLTRRVAISQILGFLTLENGIYIFAATQTKGMPMFVEMGILLDVLVGVMISGLLVFGIQKSFEHIDVTQLAELKD